MPTYVCLASQSSIIISISSFLAITLFALSRIHTECLRNVICSGVVNPCCLTLLECLTKRSTSSHLELVTISFSLLLWRHTVDGGMNGPPVKSVSVSSASDMIFSVTALYSDVSSASALSF